MPLIKKTFAPVLAKTAIALAVAVALLPARAGNVTWVGPDHSFWDLAGNWNAGSPGAADDVLLGAFATEFRSGTLSIRSFNGSGSLLVSGGALTVDQASAIGSLAVSGGILAGPATITAGSLAWSGGSLGQFGTVGGTIKVNGLATIDGGQALGLTDGQALALNGQAIWSAGNGSINIYSGGLGSNNPGTSTLNIGSGATFTDQGTVADGDNRYLGVTSDGVVNNAGTYVRTGVGTTVVDAVFNNTGVVTVSGGTLGLFNGGTSSGTLNIASGAVLAFSSGLTEVTGGTIANAGTLLVNGGTLNLHAGVGMTGHGAIDVSGGLLDSATSLTLTPGSMTLSGSTARFAGNVDVGSLNLLGSGLGGGGTITAGSLTWTGGSMGEAGGGIGVTTVNGAASIDGTQFMQVQYGRTLNLNGATTWSPGSGIINIVSGGPDISTLNIGSGATFADQGTFGADDSRNLGNSTDGVVNNAGTYLRTGIGVTTVGSQFNNTGVVTVDGGTLNLTNGGSSSSTINIASGAEIGIWGGTFTLTGGTLNNAGSFRMSDGIVVVSAPVAGTGSGVFTIAGGALNVLVGGSIAPGNLAMSGGVIYGAGTVNAGTLAWSGGEMGKLDTPGGAVNVSGTASLDGSQSLIVRSGQTLNLNGQTTWSAGNGVLGLAGDGSGTATLHIGSGATFTDQGTLLGANVRLLGDGSNGVVSNAGTYLRNGLGTTSVVSAFDNSGVFDANAGATSFHSLQGTGTLQIAAGASVDLSTSDSTVGKLLHNGSAASSLNIGTRRVTVSGDYANASFGVGNAFNAHANVSGTGQIVGANVAQAITGAHVANGTGATAVLTIGNVHVGANTFDYQVANTGTGAALRGAIQTSVNGGNLTDARLSGTGVTASNFGPVAAGANGGNLGVTYNATTAGLQAALSGQAIHVASNFDNVAGQNLDIVLGSGAAAYRLASANAIAPVDFGNVRVGDAATRNLGLTNVAVNDGFSEGLRASLGAGTAGTTAGGSFTLLGAGATDGTSLHVGLDTSTTGARSGTATIALTSDGTGTSGLGLTALASQTVHVTGNVYQAAAGAIQSAPLNFGTVQVGQAVTRNLVIGNTATGASGFVEDLNASFGIASGASASLITGTGSLNGILAGSNGTAANGTMTVAVNTTAAGVVSGAIGVNYVTAGAVNGVSNGLGTAAVGSQSYGVSGTVQASANVINQASPLIGNATIALGAVRVGAVAPTANVSVTNVATVAPQAALSAGIAGNGTSVAASGSFNLLTPGSTSATQLSVTLNTAVAGNYTGANAGSATLSFISDASNIGGCAPNCQLTLASQQVSVTGQVFAPAIAQVNTSTIDFGIVHVGDSVTTHGVSVTNAAATTALNDVLTGSISAGGRFTATGSLAGLSAQGTNATSFQAGLNTAASGVFSGTAMAVFASHDGALADLALGSQQVMLAGQVDNYAAATLGSLGPAGILTHTGNVYTLDFGQIALGSASLTDTLAVLNSATGLADLLGGSFSVGGVGAEFTLTGFDGFSGIAAGGSHGGFGVSFNGTMLGTFDDTITLGMAGSNASGYSGALGDITLNLEGSVASLSAVPEPGSEVLMLAGLLGLIGAAWARRRRVPAI